MVYVYGILVAFQVVLGQILWKIAAEKHQFQLKKEYLFSYDFIHFVFSPQVILGVISYASATLVFMALLAKSDYTNLQAIVVSSSLALTFIAAVVVFRENISLWNLLGLVFLLAGVILITKF